MKIYITKITLVFFIAITTVISVHAQTLNVETDHITYQIPIVQIGEMTFQNGQTTSHEDEDSGNIYIEGGTLQLTTSANGGKCIKSDGMAIICNGTLTLNASGAVDIQGGKHYFQCYNFVTSSISYQPNRYYTLADASGNNLGSSAKGTTSVTSFTAK